MGRPHTERFQVLRARPKITGVQVGRILGLQAGGRALVDFPGNPFGPVAARPTASLARGALRRAAARHAEVLLAFEGNDPGRPILFDIVEARGARPKAAAGSAVRPRPAGVAEAPPGLGGDDNPAPAGRLGRIVAVRDGTVFVDYYGNPAGPRPARTTVPLRNLKDEVLLLLLPGGEPVIVGQVFAAAPMEAPGSEDADVLVKGRSVRIEASAEVVLVAGGCKVHLDARGRATTTADQVVSRARGANKVQGGSVQLN